MTAHIAPVRYSKFQSATPYSTHQSLKVNQSSLNRNAVVPNGQKTSVLTICALIRMSPNSKHTECYVHPATNGSDCDRTLHTARSRGMPIARVVYPRRRKFLDLGIKYPFCQWGLTFLQFEEFQRKRGSKGAVCHRSPSAQVRFRTRPLQDLRGVGAAQPR